MKPAFVIFSVAFWITASMSFSQTNTTTTTTTTIIKTHTEMGMDFYNAKEYKDAISEFSKAIKEDPKDGKAYYYRGMSKMHEGQKGFCKDLEESLQLGYSNSSDIYYYGCDTREKK